MVIFRHEAATLAPQEIQITAFICLIDGVHIQLPITTAQMLGWAFPLFQALGNFFITHMQMQLALGYVELNQITVLHNRQREACARTACCLYP